MNSGVFGTGQRAAAPPMSTTMVANTTLIVDHDVRCVGPHRDAMCSKLLFELAGRPWRIKCVRCGYTNTSTGRA